MSAEHGTSTAADSTTDDRVFSPLMQRLSAASGILFVVFVLLSIFTQGEEGPDWSDPAADYVTYATNNVDELQLSSFFLVLAALELLWFAGHLRGELGRGEGLARGFTRISHVAFAGGVVAAAGLALVAVCNVVAASQPQDTTPDVVRALFHLSFAAFELAAIGLVALLVASGLLVVRARTFPVWLGVIALLSGLLYFLTLFIALAPEDDDFVLGFAWFPAFILLLVWALASSIVLVRRIGRPPGRQEPAVAPAPSREAVAPGSSPQGPPAERKPPGP
jgi:hypothetical protein